jgi:hypothetical protein
VSVVARGDAIISDVTIDETISLANVLPPAPLPEPAMKLMWFHRSGARAI